MAFFVFSWLRLCIYAEEHMKTNKGCRVTAASVAALALTFFISLHGQQAQKPGEMRVTEAELDKWMKELSNWGRWGKDDQLGAVNTITPEKRKQAATLVRTGEAVSLAHDIDTMMKQATEFQQPYLRKMGIFPERQVTRDQSTVDPHGGAFTHLDALCHMAYKGRFYNDAPYETATADGCGKMGINALKDGIVTRGVLIDIPRLRNLPYLEPGTHVYREDIEAWEKQAGVKVAPGDALFLRTGRWARSAKLGPARYRAQQRLRRLVPAVSQRPGRGVDRQRHRSGRGRRSRVREHGAVADHVLVARPQVRIGRARHEHLRQSRPRSGRRNRCEAQALGVHAHRRAHSGTRWNRHPDQSDCGVLGPLSFCE